MVLSNWIFEFKANVDKVNAFYLSEVEKMNKKVDKLKKVFTNTLRENEHFGFIIVPQTIINDGSKDELEYATSWLRAFSDILTRLRWLDGFCKINYLSTKKYKSPQKII
jgi:hypothetical protein